LSQGLTASRQGLNLSLHSAGLRDADTHKHQIDLAAQLGAKIVVLHPNELAAAEETKPDLPLTADLVDHATQCGVKLALENLHENWHLPFLVEAARNVKGLGICLDIGHVYATDIPLGKYLEALGGRLVHLHLHDVIPLADIGLPVPAGKHYEQHYVPGTGRIPPADWDLLAATLRRLDYRGIAILEIRPRDPIQNALLGNRFLGNYLNWR
ncbi:MAG: sugar phosphate isomerase/epimerase family protein, partial [Chloroflexota bacterium]